MQKLILSLILALTLLASSGCILPIYSGDPLRRNRELIYTSEGQRMINDEWERFWMLDQPSHLTPYRTHGGII
jgi:hypothetical protein